MGENGIISYLSDSGIYHVDEAKATQHSFNLPKSYETLKFFPYDAKRVLLVAVDASRHLCDVFLIHHESMAYLKTSTLDTRTLVRVSNTQEPCQLGLRSHGKSSRFTQAKQYTPQDDLRSHTLLLTVLLDSLPRFSYDLVRMIFHCFSFNSYNEYCILQRPRSRGTKLDWKTEPTYN